MKSFSRVQLFVTPWTVVYQAPLSMGFSRQGYLSGLPFPSPGDLPDPGIQPGLSTSPSLTGGFFTPSDIWDCQSVQSLSCIRLSATPWTAARQASPSITNSQSLPKLISNKLVMPSNHLILCHPLLLPSIFPSIRVFSSESALCISGGQSIRVSA